MDKIVNICKKNIKLIEDCAHAIGTKFKTNMLERLEVAVSFLLSNKTNYHRRGWYFK